MNFPENQFGDLFSRLTKLLDERPKINAKIRLLYAFNFDKDSTVDIGAKITAVVDKLQPVADLDSDVTVGWNRTVSMDASGLLEIEFDRPGE